MDTSGVRRCSGCSHRLGFRRAWWSAFQHQKWEACSSGARRPSTRTQRLEGRQGQRGTHVLLGLGFRPGPRLVRGRRRGPPRFRRHRARVDVTASSRAWHRRARRRRHPCRRRPRRPCADPGRPGQRRRRDRPLRRPRRPRAHARPCRVIRAPRIPLRRPLRPRVLGRTCHHPPCFTASPFAPANSLCNLARGPRFTRTAHRLTATV